MKPRQVKMLPFRRTVHHVKTTQAREEFGTMVNRVAYGGEWIVFERRGKDLAALVPVDDLRRLEALDAAALEDPSGALPGWDGIHGASWPHGWGAAERVRRDLEVDDMH